MIVLHPDWAVCVSLKMSFSQNVPKCFVATSLPPPQQPATTTTPVRRHLHLGALSPLSTVTAAGKSLHHRDRPLHRDLLSHCYPRSPLSLPSLFTYLKSPPSPVVFSYHQICLQHKYFLFYFSFVFSFFPWTKNWHSTFYFLFVFTNRVNPNPITSAPGFLGTRFEKPEIQLRDPMPNPNCSPEYQVLDIVYLDCGARQ